MTNLSNEAQAERRIAAAQAHRTPVDSQGRPIGKRSTFTYDEGGRLVSVTPPPDDEVTE